MNTTPTLEMLDPATLTVDINVRKDAALTPDFIASIKEHGVMEPVIAHRKDDGVVQRRGVWTTVVLTGADGFSALCITDDTVSLFGKATTGSVGKPADYVVPGPRELTATALGTGTMSAGEISLASGTAGSDIVGITYKSRTHDAVTATVSLGHFALWLPGDELRNASSDGMDVEVTYQDGTRGTSRLTL